MVQIVLGILLIAGSLILTFSVTRKSIAVAVAVHSAGFLVSSLVYLGQIAPFPGGQGSFFGIMISGTYFFWNVPRLIYLIYLTKRYLLTPSGK